MCCDVRALGNNDRRKPGCKEAFHYQDCHYQASGMYIYYWAGGGVEGARDDGTKDESRDRP